jgi:hypothetical protein
MQVTLAEQVREQVVHLLNLGQAASGYIFGWRDATQKSTVGIRLQLSSVLDGTEFSISSSQERIGWFSISNASISFKGRTQSEGETFICLRAKKNHEGEVEMNVFEDGNSVPLSLQFQPTASLYQLLRTNFVTISTNVCPELVYINHNEERSPIKAIENEATRFVEELYLSSFLAEGPSLSRIISLESSRSMSVLQFCQSLLPIEASTSKRTKKSIPAPAYLELQLLKTQSALESSPTAVSIRYDAIRPSEPSLDDSTHEHFEKNAKVFHAFYPRLSVVTCIQRDDSTEGSMKRAIKRHLESIANQLEAHIRLCQNLSNKEVPHLEPFHFNISPDNQSEIVTLLYEVPVSSLEWQSEYSSRVHLIPSELGHGCFGVDRSISLPSLNNQTQKLSSSKVNSRSSPQDSASSSTAAETKIVDIHKLVPSPGSDYEVHLVKGAYEYYHYCQDGFDDKGWGCAYRSMQTIVSWLLKQNLSIKAVPSHAEIQRMLVDMLDKPPSFANSKQWIGAVEISMCLSQHWDVGCKILHAQDGTKVSSYLTELINHFDLLGSPIMAGGSVLAYTILGLAVNVVNPLLPNGQPDVKYLILDPHYIGSELPQTIISNGWCAWQPPTIWKKQAFYNLCVPQTPKWVDLR